MDRVRKQIEVRGIVQGVGFRPFVYRLAYRFHLHGHVRNTGDGVLMEVEGALQTVEEFRLGWPVNTRHWLKSPKHW
jgi:hydrogenase maturation protein HypF